MNFKILLGLTLLLVGFILIFTSVFLIIMKMPDLVLMAVILSIGILIVSIGASRIWMPEASSSKSLINFLTEDEFEILKVIVREGGESLQESLPGKTGFSPAKISRLLINLESRGIVVRGRKGKKGIVKVNEQVAKSIKLETS